METFYIHEANMERLEKKMAALSKKCKASNCSFVYNVVGEEYHTTENSDGSEYTAKFYIVEVEGTAKYEGWRFIATIDHHDEGNIIRAYDTELPIPDKYKTCGPTCEHCNKIRSRKDTYLVYNEETKEFKQVGKSCLKEFTNGLSAENIALFVSFYTQMESNQTYTGFSYNAYIDVEAVLRYAFETYKHWGYQKSRRSFDEDDLPGDYRSTKERVADYFFIKRRPYKLQEQLKEEMEEVNFNSDSEYAVNTTKAALEWIRNIDEKERSNEYIRNLYILCKEEYIEDRSLGILVSLPIAYERHLGKVAEYEKKEAKKAEEKKASEFVGEVGQRITVNTNDFACISSWESMYGTTYLYKFTDENDNIFVWYGSKGIDCEDGSASVIGTVKDHSEYEGVKQTILTRCKVS